MIQEGYDAGVIVGDITDESVVARRAGEQTIKIAPVMTSEGVTSLREAALAGLGVSVLPEWLVRKDLAAGRLRRVLPQWIARELFVNVVHPGHRNLPSRVRSFVEFAVSYMTTEMHTH